MNDCNNISILPNYLEYCWLNAIIICVLYSELSRNLLINEIENLKNTQYIGIIKELLIAYYTNKKNILQYFKSIDPISLLSEIFNTKEKKKLAEKHIINFYKYLGIKCLGIAYFNNNGNDIYITKEIIKSDPDVIVFFHQDLNNYSETFLNHLKSKDKISRNEFILSATKFTNLSTYEEEITYNNITYILSSCLTSDTKENIDYHSVAGIYCNNTRYVYNGYKNDIKSPCSLIKYDWNIKNNELYCLNPSKCDINTLIDINDINNLCFNFGKGNRTLIYIRKDKTTVLQSKNYKIDDIEKMEEELKLDNINTDIIDIKELSIIGLLNEVEKIEKKKIELSKIANADLKRTKLEKFILSYRLKNKKEEAENQIKSNSLSKPENEIKLEPLTEPESKLEIKKDMEIKSNSKTNDLLLTQLDSDINKDSEIQKTGGYKITKTKLLENINNVLMKMKKDELLNIFNKINI